MTNYKIQDNIDWKSLLNDNDDLNDTKEYDNKCLLSKLPLLPDHITLPCGHKFNYLPLYKDLVAHRKASRKTYKQCPLCRTKLYKLLPILHNVNHVVGITEPPKHSGTNLYGWGFKSKYFKFESYNLGNKAICSMPGCSKFGSIKTNQGHLCKTHYAYMVRRVKNDVYEKWTIDMFYVKKTKKVSELKSILKTLELPTHGLKDELVVRIFSRCKTYKDMCVLASIPY